jgi:hypothetical protein
MKTIVWDVDDVLNDLTKEWFEKEWLVKHPDCSLNYFQLKSNPPNDILNISQKEYHQSLDNFRLTSGSTLKPVNEIYLWFKNYGHNYQHIVLTSTPLFYAPNSSDWIFRHFGEWIRSYNILPSSREYPSVNKSNLSKASYLKLFNVIDLFIDDNEKNISEVSQSGIDVMLMPRPWNKSQTSIKEFIDKLTNL